MSHHTHFFFFFNDPAPPKIYPLSLHDALPICLRPKMPVVMLTAYGTVSRGVEAMKLGAVDFLDRKSTRLNSSHSQISYAVFCLKKKKTRTNTHRTTPTCRSQHYHSSPSCEWHV